jgi:phage tail-like protein
MLGSINERCPAVNEKNLDYLYEYLPAFMRRDDEGLFLKRFLSFFGQQLDGFDRVVDELHSHVAPETAPEEFLDFWLWAFFGRGWFPEWMTLVQKRQF